MINKEKFKELAKILNYEFKNIDLLILALNGKKLENYKGKNNKELQNETLAQLGDSILKLVIVEYFYDKDFDKERIQKEIEKYGSNENLIKIRDNLNLKEFIHNEEYFYNEAPEDNKPSFNSKNEPYVEAIIGAMYKDSGYDDTRKWIIKIFNIEKSI